MLRIVGVERSEEPEREFVLLQNQGHLRVRLRGHAIVADVVFDRPKTTEGIHLFPHMEDIPGGCYVMLISGQGQDGWKTCQDGTHMFVVFAGRDESLWNACSCDLRVLSPNCSFMQSICEPLSV